MASLGLGCGVLSGRDQPSDLQCYCADVGNLLVCKLSCECFCGKPEAIWAQTPVRSTGITLCV